MDYEAWWLAGEGAAFNCHPLPNGDVAWQVRYSAVAYACRPEAWCMPLCASSPKQAQMHDLVLCMHVAPSTETPCSCCRCTSSPAPPLAPLSPASIRYTHSPLTPFLPRLALDLPPPALSPLPPSATPLHLPSSPTNFHFHSSTTPSYNLSGPCQLSSARGPEPGFRCWQRQGGGSPRGGGRGRCGGREGAGGAAEGAR